MIDFDLEALDFEKSGGFVTVIAQDVDTGIVLMVARADRDCMERTLSSGEMHYHSRTRGPWHKGETSGNVQRVVSLTADCDGDAVLALVRPAGPACHTGSVSCFTGAASERGAFAGRSADGSVESGATADTLDVLDALDATIAGRGREPADSPSYTRKLLANRNLRLKKLGEESAELVVALSDGDAPRATEEGADLLYHMLVALRAVGVSLADVRAELGRRAAASGAGR